MHARSHARTHTHARNARTHARTHAIARANRRRAHYLFVPQQWNSYWGDRGYFKILKGVNECGIESDIVTVEV